MNYIWLLLSNGEVKRVERYHTSNGSWKLFYKEIEKLYPGSEIIPVWRARQIKLNKKIKKSFEQGENNIIDFMRYDLVTWRNKVMMVDYYNPYRKIAYLISENFNQIIVKLSEIVPIPITSEILEKNDWVFDEIGGDYYNRDIHFRIYGKKSPYMIFDGVEINYIHELQHALKLRKIEKRIIL